MGKCATHPNRETSFVCLKYNRYRCRQCLDCSDPKIYCKFRSACPIWYMLKTSESWHEPKSSNHSDSYADKLPDNRDDDRAESADEHEK